MIESRFIPHADKEAAISLTRIESRGRHNPLCVTQSRFARRFMPNGRYVLGVRLAQPALYNFDRDRSPQ